MGKTKRNKRKATAKNPTGLPSVRDVEEDELGSGDAKHMSKQEAVIQTLVDLLQSANAEDKVLGLQTLATIFNAPESVQDVMKLKVVKVAAPLLFDPSASVKHAAAGALRNLSACGSHEICGLLVEQDVMTPLTALIQKYTKEWQPSKKRKEGKLDETADTFTHAVHLLWNLCESNDTALKYFNQSELLPILAKSLECTELSEEAAIAIAQCLHTVTEDNPTAVSKLQDLDPVLQRLLNLQGDDAKTVLLRTLACGLILDVNYGKISVISPLLVTQMMCTLCSTLNVDHRTAVHKLTSALPLDEELEDNKVSEILSEVQHLLEAQQTALELLANLCSSEDGDEDAMDQDSSDLSSDDVLSESGLPDEDIEADTMEACPLSIPSDVHEAIVSGKLVEAVWNKTEPPAENAMQILKEHPEGKHIFKKLVTLRCRAFLCFNNLVSGLDLEDLGGESTLYQLWLKIGNIIFKQKELTETTLLEAATSAVRAILGKLAECKKNPFGQLSEADLQVLFSAQQHCKDENVRANIIRSIGMLGMILVQSSAQPNSHTLIMSIGRFLLDVCTRESELWVIAEAIDTIMDIFGEDETDAAAAEIGLVDRLQSLLSPLKNKVRLQRKSLGDHYLVVTTVNTNLTRFIKYKAKRLALLACTNGT